MSIITAKIRLTDRTCSSTQLLQQSGCWWQFSTIDW